MWSAIIRQIDDPGSVSEYVSVADSLRDHFHRHPWSIGGGGAAELVATLENSDLQRLGGMTTAIGRGAHTGEDDAYVADVRSLRRCCIDAQFIASFVTGDKVRDWVISESTYVLFPYGHDLQAVTENSLGPMGKRLWLFRNQLWRRVEGGGTHRSIGLTWYEFSRFHPERFTGSGICYGEIATHNNFVLDRGGKVFNRTAPVIKLPAGPLITGGSSKGANLKKVYEEVHRATQGEERIEVEKTLRPLLRAIANPLLLGEMHETVFMGLPQNLWVKAGPVSSSGVRFLRHGRANE